MTRIRTFPRCLPTAGLLAVAVMTCSCALKVSPATTFTVIMPLGFNVSEIASIHAPPVADISADGEVIVWHRRVKYSELTTVSAYFWRKTGDGGLFANFSKIPTRMFDFESYAHGVAHVNKDIFVVGSSGVGGVSKYQEAYVYQHSVATTTHLGFFGNGDRSKALDISADGTVIVGWSYKHDPNDDHPPKTPVMWTKATNGWTISSIPMQKFGHHTRATGVTVLPGPETVVVGEAGTASVHEAFRWSSAAPQASQQLGDIGHAPGAGVYSTAWAVSANGSVVVGHGSGSKPLESFTTEAFRWDGQIVALGKLGSPPGYSEARGVSADGSVIVGFSLGLGLPANKAFILKDGGPMVYLKDFAHVHFFSDKTVLQDWNLNVAMAVSDDGRSIVGVGTNDQPPYNGATLLWLMELSY